MKELVIPNLDFLAQRAVERVIIDSLNSTDVIDRALQAAIKDCMEDITPKLTAALQEATDKVLQKPGFIEGIVEANLMRSADKLSGSFDSSMRAAGKALALDRSTLTAIAEEVKIRAFKEKEEQGIGRFS